MHGKKILAVIGAIGVVLTATPLIAATPEESFRKSFPQVQVNSIRPAPVSGLYEIVSGSQILYYVPGPEYIIAGAIHTRDGRNLTQERTTEVLARNLKEAPLAKAIKIGSGPHTVIEITDPDCPYCRQASAYLAKRNDLTRYVFFFPLPIHKDAEAKVRYILCAPERATAYEEAMTGKLDAMKFKPCADAEAEALMKTHKEIVTHIGINSTPFFLIDGQVVNGADIPLMEKILGSKK
jgi:thiol:disulfide interchange protein DsbC